MGEEFQVSNCYSLQGSCVPSVGNYCYDIRRAADNDCPCHNYMANCQSEDEQSLLVFGRRGDQLGWKVSEEWRVGTVDCCSLTRYPDSRLKGQRLFETWGHGCLKIEPFKKCGYLLVF